ncbi:diacylglycerol kinase [Streptomyces sp. NWU49]|uniref:Diacylglycerol kinase n=1 Tax=Streptomyces viridosporus (strain ATCC 14672 / DSM 40746 / JCM 4963 / KCTC 9882 / NRRL B-12104 / FH 1290) TaxID=566461 RepID=D5ZRJ6_STRV1|nr:MULTISPECIES: diacylglycerol kinase [Streptomyces]EFE70503.1 diacylglycerol kinase [Streptomyces viridosporus ATCC 14672]PWJ04277.1 diacylglycerol kinase [Streptomyces sp. NWU49]
MTSEITLFVNPTAGRGRGARAARSAASALRAAGFSVRTVLGDTAQDGLARARAAVAEGTGALIAVGGDGMANLALQAVVGTGTPFGLVAAGTGNDFARALGLPLREPAAAGRMIADALKCGRVRDIDLGRVGDRWFAAVLASGFDSRVNDRGNRMRLPLGRFKYDLAVVAELAAFRPFPYRITLDGGEVREVEATLVAVGNGPSYGGGMRICPGADLTDGLFDITVVGECSRATLLRVFPGVYRGTHVDHPAITVHRAARVELAAEGVTGYADGEPVGPLPLTARCVRAAVRVVGP